MESNILKEFFHQIRNQIRFIREYNSICEIERLLRQQKIFCFWGHLGEAYLTAAVWHYLENRNDFIVLLVKEQEYVKQVFDLFPDKKNFVIINGRARNIIVKKFCDENKFLDWNAFTEFGEKNKARTMMSAFKRLGGITEETYIKPFVYENKEKQINAEDLLKRLDCKTKKTVFIFPDAESLILVNETQEFWILLADKLSRAGFSVIFNSKSTFGSYESVFLPVADSVCLAKLCGYVIGKRSGMLDVLAGTTETIIEAIYPVFTNENQDCYDFITRYYSFSDKKTGEENYLEVASLKGIRNDNKIIEVIWEDDLENFSDLLVTNIVKPF